MKWRRIRLNHLRAYDNANTESLVRSLEMAVDITVTEQGQAIQFWKDASMYGIEEAYIYLANSRYARIGQLPAVEREVGEACRLLRAWLPTSKFSPTYKPCSVCGEPECRCADIAAEAADAGQ